MFTPQVQPPSTKVVSTEPNTSASERKQRESDTVLQRVQAPQSLTRQNILQLQRTIGNQAVLQLLRTAQKNGDEATETSAAELEPELPDDAGTEQRTAEELTLEDNQPIDLVGETHTIEYKKVGQEVEIGVASNWMEINEIHQDLRRNQLLNITLTQRLSACRVATRSRQGFEKDFSKNDEKIDKIKRDRRKVRVTNPDKYADLGDELKKLEGDMHKISIKLNNARATEKARVNAYIQCAVTINSTIVAQVLGAKMPIVELDTDATAGSAGNVRYHQGTAGDPIPITWYKPQASYNAITVNDYTTGVAVPTVLNPFGGNPAVQDQHGNNYNFGVNAANVAGAAAWPNTPKHGKTRVNQQAYNQVLASLGYDLSAHNEDGDHVRDLGFGGNDVIDNFWPLNSVTNRHAFNGWRSSYYINYKKNVDGVGNWNIVKAPLNSGSLIGKYFRIKGEEDTNSPAENNTDASGSDTTYGAAANINESDGTIIAEG
ncbi:hypothetical protein CBW65_14740 [Tumebacillus avium]|uniref:Uncharacterized protein n=1 Tax=Tumebacillus avium TaxID=1903704 RepID=A0A1Y0IRN8_9BACL|nr:hypothetical protein [Tumebacillus avium]ARU62115.1 hypothetical protein CBW65_14740 [Tumebacillus avium]